MKLSIHNREEFLKEEEIILLLAEGKIHSENDIFEISNDDYLRLSTYISKKFKIPTFVSAGIKISSLGGVLTNSFEISYKLIDPSTGAVLFPVEINECHVFVNNNEYRLGYELYHLINLIENINNCLIKEDRLLLVKKVQQLIGFEDYLDSNDVLRDLEIIIPGSISVHGVTKDCLIEPILLNHDSDTHILDDMDNKLFQESFKKYEVSKSAYKITRNKFISIPNRIMPYLEIIKQESSKLKSERKSFLMNPNSKFSFIQDLDSENTVETINPFREIEDFISSRISHIGVWEPKSNIFIPSGENEWIPKDSIGLRIGEDLIFLNPNSISNLENKMEQALNHGDSEIIFEGNRISINEDTVDEIREYSGSIAKMESIPRDNSEGKEKKEVLVSIIKDNLLDELYMDNSEIRGNFDKSTLPKKLKTKTLYDHQRTGLDWLQESYMCGKRGVLLADDMGLGKTLQCLAFLCWHKEIIESSQVKKTGPYFIVGPKSLLKNWVREINTHVEESSFTNIYEAHGTKFGNLRKKGISIAVNELNSNDIVLTTYETLRDQEKFFRRIDWQVILFDECQKINNPNVLMTEMAKAMAAEFSIAITGTPVENRLSELWCIVDTIYPGYLKTYKKFRDKYEMNHDNLEELKDLITVDSPPPLMLRRMKSDEDLNIPSLPSKETITQRIPMSKTQEILYNDTISQIQKKSEKGMALKTINYLKQISISPDFEDVHDVDVFIQNSAKIKGTFQILSEIKKKDEKVILFIENRALQKKMIWALSRKYEMICVPLLLNGSMSSIARDRAVERFESLGEGFAVIIVAPKAGGAGITLVNANHVIHIDRWWNPAVEDQASDRCYRIGQEKDVTIYHPLSLHSKFGEKSFDVILDRLLDSKRELSSNVIVTSTFSENEFKELFKESTNSQISENGNFYLSKEWRELREKVFQKFGKRCLRCNLTDENGYDIQVDHIRPVSLFPKYKLDFDNLQPLCAECNNQKSNTDFTDYRNKRK